MPILNIKDDETHALASELAQLSRQSMTQAVREALKDRLAKAKSGQRDPGLLAERLLEMAREISSSPILDPRTPDEIMGYDEHGIPR